MTTADELLLKRLKPQTVRAMAGQIEYVVGVGGFDRNCEAAQAPEVLLALWEYYRDHEERKA